MIAVQNTVNTWKSPIILRSVLKYVQTNTRLTIKWPNPDMWLDSFMREA